jgi:hypothetical protein
VCSEPSYAPPNSPWRPIVPRADAGAYVSVYLSSSLGRLPVRDVLRLGDNKSDPNLETGSYGLFSTCEPPMRVSIASRGISEIFFVTSVDGARALVGRYELGWLAEVDEGDFAYATRSMRFVDPIPLGQLSGRLGTEMQKRLRNYKIVDSKLADELRDLVNSADDRTSAYLFEIDRLERMSLARTGFRYPTWDGTTAFSWATAGPYLASTQKSGLKSTPNTSPTGTWQCSACGAEIRNEARLKVCSVCHERGTLQPVRGTT